MSYSKKLKESLKSEYSDKLINDFYNPILKEADIYKRVVGYFSTAGLDLYVEGLEKLIENDGYLELVVSRNISKEDFDSIKEGYDVFDGLKLLNIEQRKEVIDPDKRKQLGNLAYLIAIGRAKVKIGYSYTGAFHDKFGLLEKENEKILFVGSVNETYSGLENNYESIVVDVCWDNSERVQSRLKTYSDRFNRLWSNTEKRVTVIEATELIYEQLAIYQPEANFKKSKIKGDNVDDTKDNSISFILVNDEIKRIDKTLEKLTEVDRRLRRTSDSGRYFLDDHSTIKPGTNYKNIEKVILITTERANRKNIDVYVSDVVKDFIAQNRYSIEQYRIIGDFYQREVNEFPKDKISDYYEFCKIVQSEVERPLYDLHLRSSFYEYQMARSANFSVPGAGKTAMILGVFAYLNRIAVPRNEKIDRILVISPISAFQSWKDEFNEVFGHGKKKILKSLDTQSSNNFGHELPLNWKISNLILVNYESLPKYENLLIELLDHQTMLIFDEVHRVKNPQGVRAESALNISKKPKFKYVLTGTPIPNSYKDIYNFLNILYPDEYSSFFGWDLALLENPRIRQIKEINQKLYPFFWRTNKNNLNVPPAQDDIVEFVEASDEQKIIAKSIYENEKSPLARLIRLMQASTNPSLLNSNIDYNELMIYDIEDETKNINKEKFFEILGDDYCATNKYQYDDFEVENISTPKFDKGIEIIEQLVDDGKKVLVWGIFVGTLKKITNTLINKGINTILVYGGTPTLDRVELINEFKSGKTQVLVSNPQTLGEAISLHKEVHDAVYFEYNFNLTFMLQSRDRIHRLGLTDKDYTQYYYVQTKDEKITSTEPGYIDQKIYSRLKDKEKIMYEALDGKDLFIEYSENEIKEALKIIDEERLRINR